MTNENRQPTVTFVEHQGDWASACADEAEAVRHAIAPARAFVDHVGSTAVSGLGGKPVVDLLVSPYDWKDVDHVVAALKLTGYRLEATQEDSDRRYLFKPAGDTAPEFHLHLAPTDAKWGRDMLIFRDELLADRELAKRYETLKKKLAAHSSDLETYTQGKSEFVSEVLRRARAALGNDRLLTHQRAELDRAKNFQILALVAQFSVALVAAASVLTDDNTTLLNLALIGFGIAGLWFWAGRRQRAHRSAGDQARRVILLSSGLGETFSAEQRLRTFDAFTIAIRPEALVREETYFASRSPPSYKRLAELVEESAYWTRDLQKMSATVVEVFLGIAVAAIILAMWAGLASMSAQSNVSLARVLVAILIFLLSTDVIGALFAHREAASAINEVLHQIEAAAARDYPSADVLMLMSNYNSAVENAPFVLPLVFSFRRPFLTRRWRSYLEQKRRSSGPSANSGLLPPKEVADLR